MWMENTICMCRFSFNIILFHPVLQLVPGFSCRYTANDALWINKGFPSVSVLISMGVNNNANLQLSFYVLKADYITTTNKKYFYFIWGQVFATILQVCPVLQCTQISLRFRCLPEGVWDPRLPTECSVKTLIRMRGCTSWYEFSLSAYAIL